MACAGRNDVLRCEVDQITCTPARVKCSFTGSKRKNYVRSKRVTVLKFTKRFLSSINSSNCQHLKRNVLNVQD